MLTTLTGKDGSPVGGATSGGWQRNSGGRCSSTHHPIGKHVSILPRGRGSIPYHKIVRPADVERENALQVFDVLLRQGNVQTLNVVLEMLDLAPTNDREYIRSFLHDIGDRDFERFICKRQELLGCIRGLTSLDALRANLFSNLLERLAHLALVRGALPVPDHSTTYMTTSTTVY